MMGESHAGPGVSLQKLSRGAGIVVALIGAVVLGGWVLGVGTIKSFAVGQVSMKPTSAAAFLLLGLSLGIFRSGESEVRRWFGQGFAAVVGLVGLLVLSE